MLTLIAMEKSEKTTVRHQWWLIIYSSLIFFLLKSLRSGVWETHDIDIGRKNPSNINFATTRNQIYFFDTIKYFQQSLGALANSLTDKEKNVSFRKREKFLKNKPKVSKRFLLCMQEGKKWVLDYLLSGKGIDNELITHYNSLDIVPDIGDFFLPHHFFFEIKRHSDVWQRI